MSIVIPKHAKKQMEKRGLTEIDIISALENGEVIMEERNHRFGLKKYTKLPMDFDDLIVVWFYNKKNDKEIVTVYWRKRGDWYG